MSTQEIPRNRVPGFIANILDSDEKVIWIQRPDWLGFLIHHLGAVGLAATSFLGMTQVFPLAWVFMLLASLPLILLFYWSYRNQFYVFTDRRVINSEGIIGVEIHSAEFQKITALNVNVHVIEKLTGTGTLLLSTAGSRTLLSSFKDPYIAYRTLKELINRSSRTRSDLE